MLHFVMDDMHLTFRGHGRISFWVGACSHHNQIVKQL